MASRDPGPLEWVRCARTRLVHAVRTARLQAQFRDRDEQLPRAECKRRVAPPPKYWGGFALCPLCTQKVRGDTKVRVPKQGALVTHDLLRRYSDLAGAVKFCDRGLALDPQTATSHRVNVWRPDRDPDPGESVRAVARRGEDPMLRRAERRPDGTNWSEVGAMVDYRTPPIPWPRVGRCGADKPHPVVAVRPLPSGLWVVDV